MDQQFCTVEEALEELRAGHLILSIDDEDRENEGDLICAAQFATTENVNFMAMHAKGLICTPMSEEIAARLGLEQMVKVNTDNHCTAFTVSIDHVDTTTRISAEERGYTCRKCVDLSTGPKTCAGPAMCSPWWPGGAACWCATATRRPRWTCAVWRASPPAAFAVRSCGTTAP